MKRKLTYSRDVRQNDGLRTGVTSVMLYVQNLYVHHNTIDSKIQVIHVKKNIHGSMDGW